MLPCAIARSNVFSCDPSVADSGVGALSGVEAGRNRKNNPTRMSRSRGIKIKTLFSTLPSQPRKSEHRGICKHMQIQQSTVPLRALVRVGGQGVVRMDADAVVLLPGFLDRIHVDHGHVEIAQLVQEPMINLSGYGM